MKTCIANLSISIIALAALVTFSAHVARTIERHQSAALAQTDNQQRISGHCYSEVMNNLFAASGR